MIARDDSNDSTHSLMLTRMHTCACTHTHTHTHAHTRTHRNKNKQVLKTQHTDNIHTIYASISYHF